MTVSRLLIAAAGTTKAPKHLIMECKLNDEKTSTENKPHSLLPTAAEYFQTININHSQSVKTNKLLFLICHSGKTMLQINSTRPVLTKKKKKNKKNKKKKEKKKK